MEYYNPNLTTIFILAEDRRNHRYSNGPRIHWKEWTRGLEPRIHWKEWFSLVPRNFLTDYGPDPSILYSIRTVFRFLFVCFLRIPVSPGQFSYILSRTSPSITGLKPIVLLFVLLSLLIPCNSFLDTTSLYIFAAVVFIDIYPLSRSNVFIQTTIYIFLNNLYNECKNCTRGTPRLREVSNPCWRSTMELREIKILSVFWNLYQGRDVFIISCICILFVSKINRLLLNKRGNLMKTFVKRSEKRYDQSDR